MPLLNFDDDFFKGEERCGFYVEPLMKRAWAAQLEVLERVKAICKRHQLKYYADFGTCLGAVRHQGFIPWDDDLDIAMPRKDLQLFIKYAKLELPETYRVINCRDYEDYDTVIVRLVNTDTITIDDDFMNEYHGFPFACGLDIFPLDYIPRDADERNLQVELLNVVSGAMAAHMSDSEATDEQKEYLIQQVEMLTGQNVDRSKNIINQMARLEDAISAMYEKKDADHLGIAYRLTYYEHDRAMHPLADYASTVEMPFENTTIAVPVGYEGYLTRQYGENYMKPEIYPAHDYPFYKDQMRILKEHLAKQGATIADIGLPDIEREAIG